MAKRLTVVHYVNQFFGQIGGEDKAGVGPSVLDGPVGPGRLLQQLLGDQGEVAATVICGDNYFNENIDKASEEVLVLIKPYRPDLVIAGPAFNAGRYGTACGQVCKTVQAGLGIPAVTGMFPENPGADLYRRDVFVVQTADSALGMAEAMKRALDLGRRIVGGAQIGSPSEEGYLPRGLKKNINADLNAAERAVSMLLAKIKNQPFETEISPPVFDRVAPPPPVADISSATIAFVTDGGLIRKGNPDRMPAGGATRWGGLAIEGMDDLKPDDFEALHGGYDCRPVNDDPDRLVPVDVARDLEREGAIGRLLNLVYSTAGLAATMDNSRRTGGAIAQELLRLRVDGVILTSTWGTSTRCGAAIAKEIERAGLPTAQICNMTAVAEQVGSNRIVNSASVLTPTGDARLEPSQERGLRRSIVQAALIALRTPVEGQRIFRLEQ